MEKRIKIAGSVLAALLLLLQPGCMTRALWTGDLTETYHAPSSPTGLALFDVPDKKDVLVQYEELGPWNDRPHIRQFLLHDNVERLELGKQPIFVSSLPLEARPLPREEIWADVSANGTTFTVNRANRSPEGPFSLPTYRGASGKAKIAVMTPLTVAVDSTVIGGWLGWWCLQGVGTAWRP